MIQISGYISESLRKADYKLQFADLQADMMRAASGAGTGSPDRVYQVTDFEVCDLWNENCDDGDELATLSDLVEWKNHAKALYKTLIEMRDAAKTTGDCGLVLEAYKLADTMSKAFRSAVSDVEELHA